MMDLIEGYAARNPRANALNESCEMTLRLLMSHARMEDELFFPAIESRIPENGARVLADSRMDHRKIDEWFRDAISLGPGSLEKSVTAVKFTREHFAKEEKILFPIAERALGRAELDQLGVQTTAYCKLKGI